MENWKKNLVKFGLVATLVVSFTGCGSKSSSETTTKQSSTASAVETSKELPHAIIGQSSWIGFAPLFIAQDKGFFKAHGADVEIQSIESKADSKSALAANRIQGVSTSADTQVVNAAAGIDIAQIFALDTSAGGDGIIAKKEYKDIESLKGKKVALDTTGGADFFWFQYLLRDLGMSLDDFDVQSMSAGNAGAAFVAGKVDAAITWQPWLSKAEGTDFGYTMMDSTASPGVIIDTFAMKKDYIAEHPEVAQAIVDGWYDALDYIKSNPDDAIAIMAKHLGEDAEATKGEMGDVIFYDEAQNKAYYGTSENPGDFYKIMDVASDLWLEVGLIDTPVEAASIIDDSFLDRSN